MKEVKKNKGINVLSLFDGMSCGRIALERAGVKVGTYYSSEIDKYAIQVADNNYPQDSENRLGDITKLSTTELDKLDIDMIIGGSPCQNLSFGGKRNGMSTVENIEILTLEHYLTLKDEGFLFEGQSYLFWEYMRILAHLKPKYFLLENVNMSEKWRDIFTKTIGTEPISINSKLLSAQNRPRLYWTNIQNISKIEDRDIELKDVITPLPTYNIIDKMKPSVRVNVEREINNILKSSKTIYQCECTSGWQDNKVGIYKSPCLRAGNSFVLGLDINNNVKKLTVEDFEKLQTVPVEYTTGVSNTQRYKMLGNGWTVEVIAHIFKHLPKEYKPL